LDSTEVNGRFSSRENSLLLRDTMLKFVRSENPKGLAVVESHLCAKSAQRWGTQCLGRLLQRLKPGSFLGEVAARLKSRPDTSPFGGIGIVVFPVFVPEPMKVKIPRDWRLWNPTHEGSPQALKRGSICGDFNGTNEFVPFPGSTPDEGVRGSREPDQS